MDILAWDRVKNQEPRVSGHERSIENNESGVNLELLENNSDK